MSSPVRKKNALGGKKRRLGKVKEIALVVQNIGSPLREKRVFLKMRMERGKKKISKNGRKGTRFGYKDSCGSLVLILCGGGAYRK